MTIKALQNLGYKKLQDKVFHPDLESDLLLMHVLKKDRSFLYAHPEKKVTNSQLQKFKKLLQRRRKGEPFAYLVGEIEFFSHQFKVNRDVLIPRPETETLVNEALSLLHDTRYKFHAVVDIGTGSGAIITSIAKAIEENSNLKNQVSNIIGTDISAKALMVARTNARKILRNPQRVKFVKGDLLSPIPKNTLSRKVECIVVANLPYLTKAEASKEELTFEPSIALKGGKKGLDLIAKLIEQFSLMAKKGDVLLLEIGAKQGPQIRHLVKKYLPHAKFKIKKDYSNFDRVAVIQF